MFNKHISQMFICAIKWASLLSWRTQISQLLQVLMNTSMMDVQCFNNLLCHVTWVWLNQCLYMVVNLSVPPWPRRSEIKITSTKFYEPSFAPTSLQSIVIINFTQFFTILTMRSSLYRIKTVKQGKNAGLDLLSSTCKISKTQPNHYFFFYSTCENQLVPSVANMQNLNSKNSIQEPVGRMVVMMAGSHMADLVVWILNLATWEETHRAHVYPFPKS